MAKNSKGSNTVDIKTSEKNSLSTTWVQCAGEENGRERQNKEQFVDEKWHTRKTIESNAIWKKADRGVKTWRKKTQSPRLVSIPEGSEPDNKKGRTEVERSQPEKQTI